MSSISVGGSDQTPFEPQKANKEIKSADKKVSELFNKQKESTSSEANDSTFQLKFDRSIHLTDSLEGSNPEERVSDVAQEKISEGSDRVSQEAKATKKIDKAIMRLAKDGEEPTTESLVKLSKALQVAAPLGQTTITKLLLNALHKAEEAGIEIDPGLANLVKIASTDTAKTMPAWLAAKASLEIIRLLVMAPNTQEEMFQALGKIRKDIQQFSLTSLDLKTPLENAIKQHAAILDPPVLAKIQQLLEALDESHTAEETAEWVTLCCQEILEPEYLPALKATIIEEAVELFRKGNIHQLDALTKRCEERFILFREVADQVRDLLKDDFTVSESTLQHLDRTCTYLHIHPFLKSSQISAFEAELEVTLARGELEKLSHLQAKIGASDEQFVEILEAHIKTNEEKFTPATRELLNHIVTFRPSIVSFQNHLEHVLNKEKPCLDAASDIIEALKEGNSQKVTDAIATYLTKDKDADIVTLCKKLEAMNPGLVSVLAEVTKATEENRRLPLETALNRALCKEIDSENFRKSFVAYLYEGSSREQFDQAVILAKVSHVPLFAIMRKEIQNIRDPSEKEMATEFFNHEWGEYQAEVQTAMTKAFATLGNNPFMGTTKIFLAIEDAKDNGLELRPMLEKVIQTLKQDQAPASQIAFAERVLQKFSSLLTVPYGVHKLNPYELLRITTLAEYALTKATTAQRLKATDPEVNLSRSLLIDPQNHSFTIISGRHGDLQAKGGEGKVRAVITVADIAIQDVRKTPLKNEQSGKRIAISPTELRFAQMFMKIGTIVEYTQGGQSKKSVTMERFDTDYTKLLAKGNAAFESNEEMFDAFDQLLQTLEAMHLHKDETGAPSPITHGDLKPGNILYKKGKTQLSDFGFAAEVLKEPGRLNRHATPGYSAPEDLTRKPLAKMSPEQRKANDMFGVGQVLGLFISRCDPKAALWATNGDAPWMKKLQAHYVDKTPQNITSEVNLVRKKLESSTHPLAPLAMELLNPDPNARMDVAEARKILWHLRAASELPQA